MNNTDKTCKHCGNTFSQSEAKRVYGERSQLYILGYCSGSCYNQAKIKLKDNKTRFTVLETGRWIDVPRNQVSDDTFDILCKVIEYKDQRTNEDMLNIHEAWEGVGILNAAGGVRFSDNIQTEIKNLYELASTHRAAYVRFVNS